MESVLQSVNSTLTALGSFYSYCHNNIPGTSVIVRYIQNSYQNDPFRIALELLLVVFAFKYLFSKTYKPDTKEVALTDKEIDELVEEWQPSPLVPSISDEQEHELESLPVIQGPSGTHVRLVGESKDYLNLSSYDFLGLSTKERIHQKTVEALRKYGVGACGPPGFYGTIDVHLELEKALANFIGTEESIIYAQAFSTISGVIPAFSKRHDILVVDDGVNFAIQKGVQISRSIVKYFKHNDMDDLERVLREIKNEDKKHRRPLARRFIVIEGLYQNFGDIAPLPQILKLKSKYKYRLICEESMSFGILGPRGAGICDHFGVNPSEVEIISASMAHSLSSAGGFCAGSKEIVDHQRLSGVSYCFSAALPAMLAVAAIEGLNELKSNPQCLVNLRANIKGFRSILCNSRDIRLDADQESPVQHIRVNKNLADRQTVERHLQGVVDELRSDGILLSRAKYVNSQEINAPTPSIRVLISAAHTKAELETAAKRIKRALEKLVK